MKRRKFGRHNKIPYFSIAVIILFLIIGVFGQYIAPYDATKADLSSKLLPPAFIKGGSSAYLFGTDEMGRDVLSIMIAGGRVSLFVSLSAIIVGGGVGTILGIVAGYFGRTAEGIISRLTDASLAFPSILLALLLSLSIGPGEKATIISIAFSMWAKYTRTVKSDVILLKNTNYVTQAKIMGAGKLWIIRKHILPNIRKMLVVMVSLEIGMAIITEASLGFLGLSVVPPTPSWGTMIADGKNYFLTGWWVSVFPTIATVLTALSFQKFGEWIRDRRKDANE